MTLNWKLAYPVEGKTKLDAEKNPATHTIYLFFLFICFCVHWNKALVNSIHKICIFSHMREKNKQITKYVYFSFGWRCVNDARHWKRRQCKLEKKMHARWWANSAMRTFNILFLYWRAVLGTLCTELLPKIAVSYDFATWAYEDFICF